MTRDEILAMEPGRELDEVIADKVMRFTNFYWLSGERFYGPEYQHNRIPDYSTDISAAFEVWEHDRPEDWYMNLHWSKGKYVTEIIRENPEDGYKYLAQVESESAAEAMTKCRLLAVMDHD